jgi:hypothetical protein
VKSKLAVQEYGQARLRGFADLAFAMSGLTGIVVKRFLLVNGLYAILAANNEKGWAEQRAIH